MAAIDKATLKKLKKKLGSDTLIGKKFGITRQAVHQLRVKYGIAAPTTDTRKRDKAILKAYKKFGHGPTVAQKFGLSEPRVYAIIRKARKVKHRGRKKK